MATRTIKLDHEAEATLREIERATGLPSSEAVKRGLRSFKERLAYERALTPYAVYRELDLGPGGYANASSTETRRGALEAIQKKLRR